MNAIAIPERKILVPRFEFPAWLRHGRERAMLIPQIATGGIHGGINAGAVGVASGASDWWLAGGAVGCVQALNAKGASSYANSLLDLSGSGNNATTGVQPTWANGTGWTFNGTTQYIKSGIIPNSGYTFIVRFSGVTASLACIIGSDKNDNARRVVLLPCLSASVYYFNGNNSSLIAPGAVGTGVLAMAGQTAYRNGAAESGTIGAWSGGASDLGCFIGARNLFGSADLFADGTICAVAIYNTTLTGSQIAAITTAMNAL